MTKIANVTAVKEHLSVVIPAPQDVIPAKAGIHEILKGAAKWIPASAGMTPTKIGIKMVKIILSLILITALTSPANADKLKITSNNLVLTQDQQRATFEGDVKVTFDDLKLTTSKLNIFYSDINGKRDIKEIRIPSKLKLIRNCNGEVIIADSGKYDNSAKKLTLKGNVRMLKDGNVLVTNKLVYFQNIKSIDHKKNAK